MGIDDSMIGEMNRRIEDRRMTDKAMSDGRKYRARVIISRLLMIGALAITLLASIDGNIPDWKTFAMIMSGMAMLFVGMSLRFY